MSTGNFGHISDARFTGLWCKGKLIIDEKCNINANELRGMSISSSDINTNTLNVTGNADFEQNIVVAGETILEGNLDVVA